MIARQILPLSTLRNVKKTVWRTYWCCWGVMGWKINVTNNKFFKTFSSKKLEILPPSGCPPFVNCISTYFPWKWKGLKTVLQWSKLHSFGNYHILLNLTGYNKPYYKTKNTVFPLRFKSNGVLGQFSYCHTCLLHLFN